MCLIWSLFKKCNAENNNQEDSYNLEDWQEDLVDKGLYDPWNFDENELEEDDCYYEDDEEE